MAQRNTNEAGARPTAQASQSGKRSYRAPQLQEFGKLHRLTQGSTQGNGDAGAQTMAMSERRLKENIVRVGDHPLGFGLYLFDYKAEFAGQDVGRQFGVMVDEVEPIVPGAISVGADGIKRVNYGMLGIVR